MNPFQLQAGLIRKLPFSGDIKFDIDEDFIETVAADMPSPESKLIACIPHESNEYQGHHIEIDEYEEDAIEEDVEAMVDHTSKLTSNVEKTVAGNNSIFNHIIAVANSSSMAASELKPSAQQQMHPQSPVAEQQSASGQTMAHSDDPDKQFLLSYLPVFYRLSSKQNGRARMGIQKLLFDIEFNDDESGNNAG